MNVYIVYYTMQDYDDSDQLDSIWSTQGMADLRLDEIDTQYIERMLDRNWAHNRLPSENGWAVEEILVDEGMDES